jgi:hypothetical protein
MSILNYVANLNKRFMSGVNEAISEHEQTERKHRENGINAKRSPIAWLTNFRIESLLI